MLSNFFKYLQLISNPNKRSEIAIREALIEEEKAIVKYSELRDSIKDPTSIKVLDSIIDEERVHVGEFQKVLNRLCSDEQSLLDKGSTEVDDMV